MRRVILAALIAALPLHQAEAEFVTGNRLLASCTDKAEAMGCMWYIVGISDALNPKDASIGGWRACLPDHTSGSQVRDVAVQWLQRHPEKRHFAAPGLVAAALEEAFPCP